MRISFLETDYHRPDIIGLLHFFSSDRVSPLRGEYRCSFRVIKSESNGRTVEVKRVRCITFLQRWTKIRVNDIAVSRSGRGSASVVSIYVLTITRTRTSCHG